MRSSYRIRLATPVALFLAFAGAGLAQQANFPSPPEVEAAVGADVVVVTRAPLHEAFATPTTVNPIVMPIIKKQPPAAIEELPPDHRPAGDSVIWIPGYWYYDDEREDFVWMSGIWRNVPPGRQWVPGYWSEVDGGHRWAPGAWVEAGAQVTYQPAPPESQERGPSTDAPSAEHFYVPGNWVYRDGSYKWRPGYWAPFQNDWVWVPARYAAARNGYIYSEGYWDYAVDRRGQLFAPVYFSNRGSLGTDFRYTPAAVLGTDARLFLHLFVNADRGQYLFGDYYADEYVKAGVRPWFEYHRRDHGYDPLFTYYHWQHGPQHLTKLQGWHKYFVGHPEFRPRHTLAEQLAFAADQKDFQYLGQTVLGDTLNRIVSRSAGTQQFLALNAGQRQAIAGIANQIRGLTGERLRLESGVSSAVGATIRQTVSLPAQPLKLPEIPGIRVPRIGRDVPDLPLNLRNVAPRIPLPVGDQLPSRLPIDLPNLPF